LTTDLGGKKVLIAKPPDGNNLKDLDEFSPIEYTCSGKKS